jgi:hypothetical protein
MTTPAALAWKFNKHTLELEEIAKKHGDGHTAQVGQLTGRGFYVIGVDEVPLPAPKFLDKMPYARENIFGYAHYTLSKGGR